MNSANHRSSASSSSIINSSSASAASTQLNRSQQRSGGGSFSSVGAAKSSSPSSASAASKSSGPLFPFANVGLSPSQAAAIWESLKVAIIEIQSGNASKLRFEEVYRNSYTLVLHKFGEKLYNGVQECVSQNLLKISNKLISSIHSNNNTNTNNNNGMDTDENNNNSINTVNNNKLLSDLVDAFDHHKLVMSMIRDILMSLDKSNMQNNNLIPIYEMGLFLFRDCVLHQYEIISRIKPLLIELIKIEREGGIIDRGLMKSALSMLVDCNAGAGRIQNSMINNNNNSSLSSTSSTSTASVPIPVNLELYQNDFEKEFLLQTRLFYQHESQLFITQNTVQDYLKRVEIRINEEEIRLDTYLHKSTRYKLRSILQEELLIKYAKQLINDPLTGCYYMYEKYLLEDLQRCYLLFSLCNGNSNIQLYLNSNNNNDNNNNSSSSSSNNNTNNKSNNNSILELIRDSLCEYIKREGIRIISDKENQKNPTQFVQLVLDCRLKYSAIVENSFKNDRLFTRGLKESLEYFINLDSRSAQYLSLYIDELFRLKIKGLNELEIENKLNSVIMIFRYLQDKDIFEDYYKQYLSMRLLNSSSQSSEIEKLMISKLKTESGHQFTSRLEGMFRDVELSKSITRNYANSRIIPHHQLNSSNTSNPVNSGIEMQISILTTGFWPVQPPPELKLPQEIQLELSNFQLFYNSTHSGRKLTWHLGLGNSDLRINFMESGGRKELQVHNYQMLILLQFNNRPNNNQIKSIHSPTSTTSSSSTLVNSSDSIVDAAAAVTSSTSSNSNFSTSPYPIYTFSELQHLTGLPESDLAQHLLSLAHPKAGVLLKNPNNKSIDYNHLFQLNRKFQSKLFRTKIPVIPKQVLGLNNNGGIGINNNNNGNGNNQGNNNNNGNSMDGIMDSNGNESAVPPAVLEGRKNRVDASLVRIMKSRKTLDHNNLMSEVQKQLTTRFPVEPAFVKKRIENLIEREYIERDKDDRRVYHYLA